MKNLSRGLLALFGAAFLAAGILHADQQIAYPTVDDALFAITAPDDWELTQAESEEEFFSIEGPTGAILFFRALPGDLEESIDEHFEYLEEEFKDVNVNEPTEIESQGYASLVANGSGTSKEDDSDWIFGMAWFQFPDGTIAEIWFEAPADDAEGTATAKAILDSFQPIE